MYGRIESEKKVETLIACIKLFEFSKKSHDSFHAGDEPLVRSAEFYQRVEKSSRGFQNGGFFAGFHRC